MAIEGPLRELGIHDVFQLLDLSRKTGKLTITSVLRDNKGTVLLRPRRRHPRVRSRATRIRSASCCCAPGRSPRATSRGCASSSGARAETRKIGELLVEAGALSRRELERQVRFQLEEVVFEMMSWREGFFSFEEGQVLDAPAEADIRISTESLLMEGARRIDEWSLIVGKVPHVGMIPAFAAIEEDHAALLDLLPKEWEVLAQIDGVREHPRDRERERDERVRRRARDVRAADDGDRGAEAGGRPGGVGERDPSGGAAHAGASGRGAPGGRAGRRRALSNGGAARECARRCRARCCTCRRSSARRCIRRAAPARRAARAPRRAPARDAGAAAARSRSPPRTRSAISTARAIALREGDTRRRWRRRAKRCVASGGSVEACVVLARAQLKAGQVEDATATVRAALARDALQPGALPAPRRVRGVARRARGGGRRAGSATCASPPTPPTRRACAAWPKRRRGCATRCGSSVDV